MSKKSKSKSKSKTKKKGNYRSFLKCEMKRLKKANPNVRQASIMKMAAKNWNKAQLIKPKAKVLKYINRSF